MAEDDKIRSKWVTFVDEELKNHPYREDDHVKIRLSNHYYSNRQYKLIREDGTTISDARVTRANRCIYNFINLFGRSFTSKMTKGKPIPKCRPYPFNSEYFDEEVASIGNDLMTHFWIKNNISSRLTEMARRGFKEGYFLMKVFYDEKGGEKIKLDREKMADLNPPEEGEERKELNLDFGRIVVENVDGTHFYPNPVSRNENDIRWVAHRFEGDRKAMQNQYGGKFTADIKEDIDESSDITSETHDRVMGHESKEAQTVWVNDIYHIEEEKHVVVINERVVVEEDLDGLPFGIGSCNPNDNRLRGHGYVEFLTGGQVDFNKSHSLIQENLDMTAWIKWIVNRQSRIGQKSINNFPGEVIEYDGEVAPRPEAPPPLPNYVSNRPEQIRATMQSTVLGLTDPGLGRMPYRSGAGTSGVVIEGLKGSEEEVFSQDVEEFTRIVKWMILRVLKLFQEKSNKYIIMGMIGKDKEAAIDKFFKADLNGYDIWINIGAGFEISTEARLTLITQLLQAGLFGPEDKPMILESLTKVGGLNQFMSDYFADEKKAKDNLSDIVDQGFPANINMVSKHDNLDAHIKVFKEFVRRKEWKVIGQPIQKQVENYIDICIGLKQMLAMSQPQMAGNNMPQSPDQAAAEANLHQSPGAPPVLPEEGGLYAQ